MNSSNKNLYYINVNVLSMNKKNKDKILLMITNINFPKIILFFSFFWV